MDLGAFSVSLAVKDLEASRRFYEKLGFAVFGGDAAQAGGPRSRVFIRIALSAGASDRSSTATTTRRVHSGSVSS